MSQLPAQSPHKTSHWEQAAREAEIPDRAKHSPFIVFIVQCQCSTYQYSDRQGTAMQDTEASIICCMFGYQNNLNVPECPSSESLQRRAGFATQAML
jgi:hypothetical protein